MSKKDNDKGNQLKAVNIPQLPKYDEKDRDRWASEYDKVEAELLKTHIPGQGNASTCTLGLRLLPAQWDRVIPPLREEVDLDPGRPRKSKRGGSDGAKNMSSSPGAQYNSFSAGGMRASTTEPGSPGFGSSYSAGSSPELQHRPHSARRTQFNVTASLAPDPSIACHDAVRVLQTIIDPPVQFKTSFDMNLDHIDLSWAQHYRAGDRTPQLGTLDTVREDMHLNPSGREGAAINSPRSAIVMIRNGLGVDDLQIKPYSHFVNPGTTEKASEMAHKHHNERRKHLLTSVRDEYRALCMELPLVDLLDTFASAKSGDSMMQEATAIKARREKQKSALEISKDKLQKQLEYTDKIQHRSAEAEMKRVQMERDMEQKRLERREETRKRGEDAMKRISELKQSTENLGLQFLQKLEGRRQMMEDKERERRIAREKHAEETKKLAEERTNQKKERVENNRRLLQLQREQQEEDYLAKERAAAERKDKLDDEKNKEKSDLQAQQRKARELREHTRAKAIQHERELMEMAEEKRQHADEKHAQYMREREKQRQEEREAERRKAEQRRHVFLEAESRAEGRRQQIVQHQQDHDEMLDRVGKERRERGEEESELRRLEQEDKQFLVHRQTKAMEFRKLMSVGNITRKREKAEHISQQRQKLLEATMKDRETVRLERERMSKELERRLNHSVNVASV